jgi:hypothetical protein
MYTGTRNGAAKHSRTGTEMHTRTSTARYTRNGIPELVLQFSTVGLFIKKEHFPTAIDQVNKMFTLNLKSSGAILDKCHPH